MKIYVFLMLFYLSLLFMQCSKPQGNELLNANDSLSQGIEPLNTNDSLAVYQILAENGYFNSRISDFVEIFKGRVICLTLTSKPNIYQISNSIGDLSELQSLYIGWNSISSLPWSICSCKKLRSISILATDLESLPDSIFSLPELVTLAVSNNKLVALPEIFDQHSKLETLMIGHNDSLKILPSNIGMLKNLSYLGMKHCAISSLPNSLFQIFPHEVFLDSNYLCNLSDSAVSWANAVDTNWLSTQICQPRAN